MRYVPQLDGLRAICVAFTILDHIGPHPSLLNGNVGVDVFFVLSGFLITTLLLDESLSTGRVCLKCFYIRRLFRIAPLYYLTFIGYAVCTYALYRTRIDPLRWAEFQAAAPALAIFMGDYRPAAAGTMFGHAWTVAIEEKYYLAWPLLLIGLERFNRALKYSILVLFIVVAWIYLPGEHEARGYGGLAIGSLVGLINRDGHSVIAAGIRAISTHVYLAFTLIGYALVVLIDGGKIHVVLQVASALLICNLVEYPIALNRVLSSRPLIFIGRRSYSVYLVHVLVANSVIMMLSATRAAHAWYVTFGLTLGLSVLIASVTKPLIEDPMIALGRNLSKRVNRYALRDPIRPHAVEL